MTDGRVIRPGLLRTTSTRREFLAAALGTAACAPFARASGAPAAPVDVDLVIADGYVVTCDPAHTVYRRGSIAIAGARIVAVADAATIRARYRPRATIDASRSLVLPGFVNTHLHPGLLFPDARAGVDDRGVPFPDAGVLEEPGPPGALAQGGDYERFLARLMKRCRYGIGPEDTFRNAMHQLLLGVRSGSTCFVDCGAGETREIARAQQALGLRGLVTRTAYDLLLPSPTAERLERVEDVDRLLREAEALCRELHGSGGGLTRYCYNLFIDCAASDELIRDTADAARRAGVIVSCHTSAAGRHDEFSVRHFGRRGLERLEAGGALAPNFLGAHVGFVDDAEIRRLAERRAKVAHCPGTSCFSGKGILSRGTPVRLMRANVTVGLGTDTADTGDLLHEAQRLYAFAKDVAQDDRLLPAHRVLEMLTIDGARCAGWEREIGSLEPDKRADVVLVDLDQPHYWAVEPLTRFLTSGQVADVHTVLVDGRPVVRARRVVTVDEEAFYAGLRRGATNG